MIILTVTLVRVDLNSARFDIRTCMYKREFETLVRHIIFTKKENFSKTKAWIKQTNI